MIKSTYITVRTQFEGFHKYPGASKIDPRIEFLEYPHRHMFQVTAQIETFDDDREIEFFICLWDLEEMIAQLDVNNQSCETLADTIACYLIDRWSDNDRYVMVTVSEDGESDGTVEYMPEQETT